MIFIKINFIYDNGDLLIGFFLYIYLYVYIYFFVFYYNDVLYNLFIIFKKKFDL